MLGLPDLCQGRNPPQVHIPDVNPGSQASKSHSAAQGPPVKASERAVTLLPSGNSLSAWGKKAWSSVIVAAIPMAAPKDVVSHQASVDVHLIPFGAGRRPELGATAGFIL